MFFNKICVVVFYYNILVSASAVIANEGIVNNFLHGLLQFGMWNSSVECGKVVCFE